MSWTKRGSYPLGGAPFSESNVTAVGETSAVMTSQPQGFVNLADKGWIGVWCPPMLGDVVTGRKAVNVNSGVSLLPGIGGRAFTTSGQSLSSTSGNGLNTGVTLLPGKLTTITVFNSADAPSASGYGAPFHKDQYGINWHHANPTYQGVYTLHIGSTYPYVPLVDKTANKLHVVVCTWDSTILRVWQNGRFCGSSTASGTLNTAIALPLTINVARSTAFAWNGSVYLAGLRADAVSDEYAMSLSANPWQIFKSPSKIIWERSKKEDVYLNLISTKYLNYQPDISSTNINTTNSIGSKIDAVALAYEGGFRIFSEKSTLKYATKIRDTSNVVKSYRDSYGIGCGVLNSSQANSATYLLHPLANSQTSVWESPKEEATIFVVFQKKFSTATGSNPIFSNSDANIAPWGGWSFQDRNSGTFLRFELIVNNSYDYVDVPYSSNKFYVAIQKYDGKNWTVYLNGIIKQQKAKTGNITYVDASNRNTVISNYYGYATNNYFPGIVYMAGVSKKAWTHNEILEFSNNPWQIFKAPNRLIRLPQ